MRESSYSCLGGTPAKTLERKSGVDGSQSVSLLSCSETDEGIGSTSAQTPVLGDNGVIVGQITSHSAFAVDPLASRRKLATRRT